MKWVPESREIETDEEIFTCKFYNKVSALGSKNIIVHIKVILLKHSETMQ